MGRNSASSGVSPRLSADVLRSINRQVASRYLPELAIQFDSLTAQGFAPKVVNFVLYGEALEYFNQLVTEAAATTMSARMP